jgi:hypothetical protein
VPSEEEEKKGRRRMREEEERGAEGKEEGEGRGGKGGGERVGHDVKSFLYLPVVIRQRSLKQFNFHVSVHRNNYSNIQRDATLHS